MSSAFSPFLKNFFSKPLTVLQGSSGAGASVIFGLNLCHALQCFLHLHHYDHFVGPSKCPFLLPRSLATAGFLCLEGHHVFFQDFPLSQSSSNSWFKLLNSRGLSASFALYCHSSQGYFVLCSVLS